MRHDQTPLQKLRLGVELRVRHARRLILYPYRGSSTTTYGYDQLGEMTSAAPGQHRPTSTPAGASGHDELGRTTSQFVSNTTVPRRVLSNGTNDYVYAGQTASKKINIASAPPTANRHYSLTPTPTRLGRLRTRPGNK